jgi:hypothetical protein
LGIPPNISDDDNDRYPPTTKHKNATTKKGKKPKSNQINKKIQIQKSLTEIHFPAAIAR